MQEIPNNFLKEKSPGGEREKNPLLHSSDLYPGQGVPT